MKTKMKTILSICMLALLISGCKKDSPKPSLDVISPEITISSPTSQDMPVPGSLVAIQSAIADNDELETVTVTITNDFSTPTMVEIDYTDIKNAEFNIDTSFIADIPNGHMANYTVTIEAIDISGNSKNESVTFHVMDMMSGMDCNQVANGPALVDSCGECQRAYVYDFVTHVTQFIDDTTGILLGPTEMIVLPMNPMNSYWNSSCELTTGTITELDASNYMINQQTGTLSGDFVKFNFSQASIVTGDNWDVAFRGTTIIVNGGESSNVDQPARVANAAIYIADGDMASITEVDVSSLLQDNSTSPAIPDDFGFTGTGWCTYNMTTHVISPIPGKVLVFRTHDNKYAKIEIKTFYDNPMTSQYGGFYTFDYVLTGGAITF